MKKTITFRGKSETIETNGNYTSLIIRSCSDKIVTPLVNFVYMDSEDDEESIEINFVYEVLYTVAIFFETTQNNECTITYELF